MKKEKKININEILKAIITRDDYNKLSDEFKGYYVPHYNTNLMQVRDDYELRLGEYPTVVKLEL